MTAARTLAAAGLGLAIAGAVGTAVVRYLAPVPFTAVAFGYGGLAMVGFLVSGLTWASIGAVLVLRRPANLVGRFMLLVGIGFVLSQLTVSLSFAAASEGTAQGQRLAEVGAWLTVLLQLAGIFLVAIGFVFPSGRVQGPGWARFMRLFWVFAVVYTVISLTQPGPLQLVPAFNNPFGFGPDLRGGRPIAPILAVPMLIVVVSLAVSMVSRYRSAGIVERQQLKWFALALGISAIGLAIIGVEGIGLKPAAEAVGLTVFVFAGAVVPVAIGIAILRHHLYDIDHVISRTITYAVVTAILGLSGGGVIVLMSAGLASYTQGQTVAVAASTLIAFAAFQPVLRRVRGAVDRRFNRARYDAERTVALFADRLRNEIDLANLSSDLNATIHEAIAPRSFWIWLRVGRR